MKKAKTNINENEQTPIDIKALIKNDNINNGNILLQKDIDTITSNKITLNIPSTRKDNQGSCYSWDYNSSRIGKGMGRVCKK